jgi:hypothetical protein
MKDQLTTLMEALRLVSAAVEQFKRKRQGRDTTLATIDSVINDPKVVQAGEVLRLLVNAPSVVPEAPSDTTTPILCPECQKPMSPTRVLLAANAPSRIGTFFCKACQFVTSVKLDE